MLNCACRKCVTRSGPTSGPHTQPSCCSGACIRLPTSFLYLCSTRWAGASPQCVSWCDTPSTQPRPLVPLLQVLAVNVATLFDSTFLCWARSRADWAAGIKRWLRLGGSSGDSKPGTQGSGGAHCEGAAGAKWARLPSSESAADVEGGEAGAPQEVQVAAPQEGA